MDLLVTLAISGVVGRWGCFLLLAWSDVLVQRRRGVDLGDVEPLTVVVPAWNEGPVITRTVDSLLASDLSDLRVVVVDDGSTDDTRERVLRHPDPRVELLPLTCNGGKPAALNAGLREARTRLVVTVDADTLVDAQCLRWLVATQRATGAHGVCANVRVGNRISLLPRFQSLEYTAGLNLDRRALDLLGLITTVPGAAALWQRETVLEEGGFSGDTLAEDTDLSVTLLRQGRRLVFCDRADAYTEAPTTLSGLFRQRRRWLAGNLACLRKHGLGRGASWPVRLIALPNLWFAHLGSYLLPLLVSAWVAIGRGGVDLPAVVTLGSIALGLDVVGMSSFYLLDRADPKDLLYGPLQRTLFPSFAWIVFISVLLKPPVAWAKITRRDTARIG